MHRLPNPKHLGSLHAREAVRERCFEIQGH